MINNIGRYNRLSNTIAKITESINKEMSSLDKEKDKELIENYMAELNRLRACREEMLRAWYRHDQRHGIE